jgi:DNA repair protein RadC
VFEYTFSRRRVAEPLGAIRSPGDVAGFLRAYVRPDEAERERLVVAVLDVKHVIIGVETLYQGNLSGCSVRVGEVFRAAVRLNASAVVVAHNHPSGDPTPSPDDLALTRDLVAAGRILSIQLLDHVVLGGGTRTASLRAMGHIG